MPKKNLIIVESPAKAKTIEKFLGKDYVVKASMGHVRDLPAYKIGIDIKNQFEPQYIDLKDKQKVIKELASSVKSSETVYLATDPDREGEAIAWHIQTAAKIPVEKIKRIVFHEITKSAVQNAIGQARDINMDLVDAQQARRVLDRLIGYQLSPILSKKIRRGLSAGRVQSVAVRLICDREKEITQFIPEEYWVISVDLAINADKKVITATLFAKDTPKTKLVPKNQQESEQICQSLEKSQYRIDDITEKQSKRSPYAPFITSTLQQDASRRFGWSTKKTMMVAQRLYEGVDIDNESTGLITYMRTDSFRISGEAKAAAKSLIQSQFGANYLPEKDRIFKSKGNVQDAHEAIRPSSLSYSPQYLKDKIEPDLLKLYTLIWNRFLASQMADAKFHTTQVIIRASEEQNTHFLRLSGSRKIFDGFTRIYDESKDAGLGEKDDVESNLPELTKETALTKKSVNSEQKFTQPPHRYTEASLIKELEEKGIGRPSTYSPILSVIQDRGYVLREKHTLSPTDLGMTVNTQMEKYFTHIVDVNFTAEMEHNLDEVATGHHKWREIIQEFYSPFTQSVDNAKQNMETLKVDKPTDEVCDKCGAPMVIKEGRFGEFLACSAYPNCKNAKPIVHSLGVKCPKCQGDITERRTRKGKVFYGCNNYPKCTFALWDKPINQKCEFCDSPILILKKARDKSEKVVCPSCEREATRPN